MNYRSVWQNLIMLDGDKRCFFDVELHTKQCAVDYNRGNDHVQPLETSLKCFLNRK